ncbi:MAG: N-acetyltransferase family protein [Bacteroidota bacterium]
MIAIRQAKPEDLGQITAIYNEAVTNTTATFDTEEKTIEERKVWFENRDENFPILVAEKNNVIAGYIALNKWSERKAYDITAEISVYVNSKFRGQGIGKLLVQTMVARAQESNLVSLIARITEGNEQSIYLHKLVGFEVMGVMKKAGKKFEKLLDVTFMQKMLS